MIFGIIPWRVETAAHLALPSDLNQRCCVAQSSAVGSAVGESPPRNGALVGRRMMPRGAKDEVLRVNEWINEWMNNEQRAAACAERATGEVLSNVPPKNTPAWGEESRGPRDRRNCLRYLRAFGEKVQHSERALCVFMSPRLLSPIPLATRTHTE